jgi:pyruvate dehydrogenase E2 component (dihydrolipoamide acetyltransferase)
VKPRPARRASSARARFASIALAAASAWVLMAAPPLFIASAASQPAPPTAPPAPATAPAGPAPSSASATARVEARSAHLLAVGTVHGERMTIHLSRLEDNAPVGDAEVVLALRGATHPATALADGGYAVETPDLALPGPAAVRIQVASGGTRQDLEGTLQPTATTEPAEDKGGSRQLGWWVLNFAVCIGFLWLWQRRKRDAPDEEAP